MDYFNQSINFVRNLPQAQEPMQLFAQFTQGICINLRHEIYNILNIRGLVILTDGTHNDWRAVMNSLRNIANWLGEGPPAAR